MIFYLPVINIYSVAHYSLYPPEQTCVRGCNPGRRLTDAYHQKVVLFTLQGAIPATVTHLRCGDKGTVSFSLLRFSSLTSDGIQVAVRIITRITMSTTATASTMGKSLTTLRSASINMPKSDLLSCGRQRCSSRGTCISISCSRY